MRGGRIGAEHPHRQSGAPSQRRPRADSCWKHPDGTLCNSDGSTGVSAVHGTTGALIPIAGSPFRFTVQPGPEDPTQFVFTGFQSEVAAGALPLITIQQRDAFGNAITALATDIVGALEVVAAPQDAPAAVAAKTFRVSAGAAAGQWTIPIGSFEWAGIWSYDVQWNGVSLGAATTPVWPQQVTVVPGSVDPGASTASGYAVAGHFQDGQEVSDDAARPINANATVQVRCPLHEGHLPRLHGPNAVASPRS